MARCRSDLAFRPVFAATHQHATGFTIRGNCRQEYLIFYGLPTVLMGRRRAREFPPARSPAWRLPLPSAQEQPLRVRPGPLHVMVIRHIPNTLDRLLIATAGIASGKEFSMVKTLPAGHPQRISRIGEKNLTRQQRHTLRLLPSSENAATLRGFIPIDGATDASGR
jgi:hypothetical protein